MFCADCRDLVERHNAAEDLCRNIRTVSVVAEIFPQFFFLAVRRSKTRLDGYPGHDEVEWLKQYIPRSPTP